MTRIVSIGIVLSTILVSGVDAETPATAGAFERLRSLVGEWEGRFEWSGARSGAGTMSATYSLTGNGSALVETLWVDGTPSMTSVYHVDGFDLRMTHFCAAQNQPRLKASRFDEAQGFVGGRIVGEVILGLLKLDRDSYLNSRNRWKPTLPTRTGQVTGDFRMVHFLTFAEVDPASRGQ